MEKLESNTLFWYQVQLKAFRLRNQIIDTHKNVYVLNEIQLDEINVTIDKREIKKKKLLTKFIN